MAINGLDKMIEKILSQAREEATRVLTEAETDCEQIRASYAERAERLRERMTDDAEREATDLIARAKAEAASKKQGLLMDTKSKLLDEVFESTFAQLRGMGGEAYLAILSGLLCTAFSEQIATEQNNVPMYGEEELPPPDRYEVLLNSRDREQYGTALLAGCRTRLGASLPASVLTKLVLADQSVAISGGLILRCGNIEANCSFDPLFLQLREELETEVNHALFQADRRA